MSDYQIARTHVERMLNTGKGKDELCREIRISQAALDYFPGGSLHLPAGAVQRIYRYLDQEAAKVAKSAAGDEQTPSGAEQVGS